MYLSASGPVLTWGPELFVHFLLAWNHPDLFLINLLHDMWSSFCTMTRGEGIGRYSGQEQEERYRVDTGA